MDRAHMLAEQCRHLEELEREAKVTRARIKALAAEIMRELPGLEPSAVVDAEIINERVVQSFGGNDGPTRRWHGERPAAVPEPCPNDLATTTMIKNHGWPCGERETHTHFSDGTIKTHPAQVVPFRNG